MGLKLHNVEFEISKGANQAAGYSVVAVSTSLSFSTSEFMERTGFFLPSVETRKARTAQPVITPAIGKPVLLWSKLTRAEEHAPIVI